MLLNSGACVPETTTKIILLCTLGALEQENIFRSLLSAMETTSARYLPVVADDGFHFPKSSFLDEHRKLAGSVASDDETAEALCDHIQQMFLTIGVTFDATMSSAAVLDTAAGVVANRLMMMTKDTSFRKTTTSSGRLDQNATPPAAEPDAGEASPAA